MKRGSPTSGRAKGAAEPPEQPAETDQDDRLVRGERARLLSAALRRLPEKQLEVFVLYEIEELAMADVAKAVGCPRFTAYTRLRAARRELRAFFERAVKSRSCV